MTSKGRTEVRAAYDAGAQGYLLKPASPEKIVAEVNRLLTAAKTQATSSRLTGPLRQTARAE